MYRAVIFDFDGTIVDSYEAHLESFRRALSKFGLAADDEQIYRRFGKPAREILLEILPQETHTQVDELVKEKRLQFIETSHRVRVLEGVEETLQYLRRNGVAAVLATSADRPSVMRVLSRFGLERYFDLVLSAEDVGAAKPNPDIFIRAVEKLALKPHECLVVGDSVFDVIAAKEAGIEAVAVANNRFQIEEIRSLGVPVISRISELKRYL
ncbi:MAG: HAD family hydrolase [Candidatus Bathyarchaeia archaeon]